MSLSELDTDTVPVYSAVEKRSPISLRGRKDDTVPYEIKGPSRDGVWTVVYSGDVDPRTRHEAMDVGLSMSRGKELRGLIVDLRGARLKMSTMDEHDFAAKKTRQQQLEGVRVAYLQKENAEENKFVIQMIKSSGRLAESFTSLEDAYAWLLDAAD